MTAIVHSPREQWLLLRREKITASDVAAILGLDERRRAADVYVSKLGLDPESDESNWPMIWGTKMQSAIGDAYAEHTGRRVRMIPAELPELTVHPDIPWLAASLDGDVDGSEQMPAPADGQGVLEAKATSVGHTWSDTEVPVPFQLQVTVQAACARREWGSVGAFVGMRQAPRVQDILFDPELFALLLPKLEAFHRCVQRKEPPVDDPTWFSHEAIARIWAKNNGESIALDGVAADVVSEWQDLKAQAKAYGEAAEHLGDQLRLRLAGAATGYLPGGDSLVLSNVKEGFVAAHTRGAHTRLLFKKAKG